MAGENLPAPVEEGKAPASVRLMTLMQDALYFVQDKAESWQDKLQDKIDERQPALPEAKPPIDTRPYHDRSLDISRQAWIDDYNAFAQALNTCEGPYRAFKKSISNLSGECHVISARMYYPLQNLGQLLEAHTIIGELIGKTMKDLEPRVPKAGADGCADGEDAE